MLLCVDIANADVTLGLFRDGRLHGHWRLAADLARTEDEYMLQLAALLTRADAFPAQLEGMAIASVVPALTPVWRTVCRQLLQQDALVVGAGVKTGLAIRMENPRSLGADRVANAVAARSLFGGPICVVDFGATTTFDAVAGNGDYLGHAIAPGLEMAAASLTQGAAQLPSVALVRPPQAIGRNTMESMQSGLIFGYVGLVEGLVARFRQTLGPGMQVVATGRYANLIAAETNVIQRVDPFLTLTGLRLVWEMNRS